MCEYVVGITDSLCQREPAQPRAVPQRKEGKGSVVQLSNNLVGAVEGTLRNLDDDGGVREGKSLEVIGVLG